MILFWMKSSIISVFSVIRLQPFSIRVSFFPHGHLIQNSNGESYWAGISKKLRVESDQGYKILFQEVKTALLHREIPIKQPFSTPLRNKSRHQKRHHCFSETQYLFRSQRKNTWFPIRDKVPSVAHLELPQ